VAATVDELRGRADRLVADTRCGDVVDSDAIPGAGSAPGTTIASVAVRVRGDHLAVLRAMQPPVVARSRDGATLLDLRTVHPSDDGHLADALRACAS
jgi:L-seryl-tRNA(Ser) seleniumtransferase